MTHALAARLTADWEAGNDWTAFDQDLQFGGSHTRSTAAAYVLGGVASGRVHATEFEDTTRVTLTAGPPVVGFVVRGLIRVVKFIGTAQSALGGAGSEHVILDARAPSGNVCATVLLWHRSSDARVYLAAAAMNSAGTKAYVSPGADCGAYADLSAGAGAVSLGFEWEVNSESSYIQRSLSRLSATRGGVKEELGTAGHLSSRGEIAVLSVGASSIASGDEVDYALDDLIVESYGPLQAASGGPGGALRLFYGPHVVEGAYGIPGGWVSPTPPSPR